MLLATALLFVGTPTFAQSDSARAAVDRQGIVGEPISLGSKDPALHDYLELVIRRVRTYWLFPCVKSAETGACEYKSADLVADFGIFRDGRLAFIEVNSSSGLAVHDQSALNAVKLASPFLPVPPALMERAERGSTGIPIRARFTYKVETQLPGVVSVETPTALPTKAGVVTALEGSVTARRVGLPSPVPLKFHDDIFLTDAIITGAGARVEMLLGGKVRVAMQERAMLTISESPGRGSLDLSSGQLDINVARARMRLGEVVDVRTPNAVASVRGTRMIVEMVPPQAGGAVVTHVDVLDGVVSVTTTAGTPRSTIELRASQGVTITGDVAGPLRTLRMLSAPAK